MRGGPPWPRAGLAPSSSLAGARSGPGWLARLWYPGVWRHRGVLRPGPGAGHPVAVPGGVAGLGAWLGLSVATGELLLLHVRRPGVARLHARLGRVLLWNVLLRGRVLTTPGVTSRVATSEVAPASPLVVRVARHPSLARHSLARVSSVHRTRSGPAHPLGSSGHHLLLLPGHSTRISLLAGVASSASSPS